MPFLNAPAGLRREFSGRIGPMLAKQAENRRNMSVLAQLRDILLPKLLSGELRVSEAEQQVAEVV